ncbi:hypothetical protein ACFSTC_00850 [Nonomuraea ferruginea]
MGVQRVAAGVQELGAVGDGHRSRVGRGRGRGMADDGTGEQEDGRERAA